MSVNKNQKKARDLTPVQVKLQEEENKAKELKAARMAKNLSLPNLPSVPGCDQIIVTLVIPQASSDLAYELVDNLAFSAVIQPIAKGYKGTCNIQIVKQK